MDAGLLTGMLTLCGVIVGGTINAGTNYLFERRRERFKVRTVARLLLPELAAAKEALGGKACAMR